MKTEDVLPRMRADFAQVTAFRRSLEGWSDADVAELEASIAAAVRSRADERITAAADYLKHEADRLQPFAERVRAAVVTVKNQIRLQKEEEGKR